MTPIPSTPVQAQRGTDERDDPFTVAELRSAFNRMFDLWAAVEIEKHQLEQQLRARDEEIAGLRAVLRDVRDWLGTDLFNEGDVYKGRCRKSLALIDAALQEKSRDAG